MSRISKNTKLTKCPMDCTQRRTIDNRLAERRTFDGQKCTNCGFAIKNGVLKPIFQKYSLSKVSK